jgi:hypothetical protein
MLPRFKIQYPMKNQGESKYYKPIQQAYYYLFLSFNEPLSYFTK